MGTYRESGSKFLAYAYPVTSEDEIKELIGALKREHFGAKHYCFAYRLGLDGEIWRASDDGEPSSTAGRPILGQILSNELSDILIIVVRYFGGVKLGVPGLIKAYKTAAADAIANSVICEKTASETITATFQYEQLNNFLKILKDYGARITEQEYDNICTAKFSVRLGNAKGIKDALNKINITIYA